MKNLGRYFDGNENYSLSIVWDRLPNKNCCMSAKKGPRLGLGLGLTVGLGIKVEIVICRHDHLHQSPTRIQYFIGRNREWVGEIFVLVPEAH